MAVCKLTQDVLKYNACAYSLNQIEDIYIANYDDVTATSIGAGTGGTGVKVLTITMKNSAKFYHIEPAKNTATYEDALVVGDNGNYRNPSVTFNIGGVYDDETPNIADALSLGKFIVVCKMTSGEYIMFGRLRPLEASAQTITAAAEIGGFQGLTVTLAANTTESPIVLSDEAVATVTGAVAGD